MSASSSRRSASHQRYPWSGERASRAWRKRNPEWQHRRSWDGTLDNFTTTGVFLGPDPVADRVITVGDTLDGDTITGLRFCEEGLNDSGQLTFITDFQDPTTLEQRTAVYRGTPAP